MPKSTAYLTHDEVNAAFARRIAARLGHSLTVLAVKDIDEAAAADLLVLDLDHLPPVYKSTLLERAAGGELRPGVAVHSYHLGGAEVRTLRAAGVRVTRRLGATTFGREVAVECG